MSKTYQMAIELNGRLASSFRGAFTNAGSQLQRLEQHTRQLRNSQRALDAAYANGEVSVRDYQDRLRQLQGQLDRTAAAQRRLQALQNQRSRIQGQNDNLSGKAAATAAAAAPFAGMLAAADTYGNAQKQIQIQNNLTTQQQKTAWEVVRQAHLSGLGEDVQATAAAYGQMSSIIKNESTAQQKTALQTALAIEKYWNEAPDATAKAVQNLTSNFKGLSSTGALNIITAGFKNGMNYAGDYLDTLYEYSPQFESLGYNAQQFYSVLAAGKAAGAFNLDKVADAVKEFNIRAKDGSKTTAEGFAAIGLDAGKMANAIAKGGDQGVNAMNQTIQALRNIEDPVKRNQAGVALFGTQWEDLTEKVILNMNVTDKAGKSIEGTAKKVVDAATGADKGIPSWTQVGRAIQDVGAAFGKTLLPSVYPVSQAMVNAANATAKFAEEHPGLTRAVTTGAAGLVGLRLATIGAQFGWNQLRLAGNTLRTGIEGVRNSQLLATGATKGLTLAQKALNLVMKANPYARVAMLIAGLVSAGIYLYKNWDTVKAKAAQLWDAISNSFKSGVNKAIGWINELIVKMNKLPGVNIGLINPVATSGSTATNALGIARHAAGGILTRPHVGMVAEAGPEAVIPLDGSRRSVNLWQQAGQMMGMGGGGETIINISAPFNYSGPGGQNLQDAHGQYMADLESTVERVLRKVQHNSIRVAYS